jgi:hypothetical protein
MEKQDRFLIPKDKTQGRPYFLALLDPESQKEVDWTEYQDTPPQRAYKQNQLIDQPEVYKDTTQIESALSRSRKLISETTIRVHQFTSGIRKHFIKKACNNKDLLHFLQSCMLNPCTPVRGSLRETALQFKACVSRVTKCHTYLLLFNTTQNFEFIIEATRKYQIRKNKPEFQRQVEMLNPG